MRPLRSSRFWLAIRRQWTAWRRRVARDLDARRSLGQQGEAVAAKALQRKGYLIVARSRRDRLGEIDLVAVDRKAWAGRTIVFVEVKTRRSHDAGHPAEAVHEEKQRRLTRLALSFLKRRHLLGHPTRFDVVAVTWPAGKGKPTIEHIVGAFEAGGLGDSMFA